MLNTYKIEKYTVAKVEDFLIEAETDKEALVKLFGGKESNYYESDNSTQLQTVYVLEVNGEFKYYKKL